MPLSIPSRYLSRINKIRMLSDSAAEELELALASSSVTPRPKEMATRIAPLVPNISQEDVFPVVDALYALYRVREYSELDRKSFLREIIDSIKANADPEISETDVPAITERFKRLLKIETLESISKAVALQRDGDSQRHTTSVRKGRTLRTEGCCNHTQPTNKLSRRWLAQRYVLCS
jgi:hypothetical protein